MSPVNGVHPKRPRYGILDPYLWSHMQYMWATPHDDHVCFACEQQALRQQQKLVESESESCG